MPYNLTVVIPVYNGMPFLKDTVESLLNQTYQDFQILIIDDGSKDDSANYLKSLDDPRIEVRFQKNMGLSHTLNQAITNCQTEFVARLDQDDLAVPTRLEEQMNFLTSHPDYVCVLSNNSRITENGKEFEAYDINSAEEISDYQSSLYGPIIPSTMCFRRDSFVEIGAYRAFLYPADDYDLLLRMEENYKMAVINKPLIKYRICSNSGTVRTFSDLQFKTRYIEAMARFRRSGKPEISLTEFSQTLDYVNPIAQWFRNLDERGRLMFRNAGLMIGEGKLIQGFFYLMGACLFSPIFSFNRLFIFYKGQNKYHF